MHTQVKYSPFNLNMQNHDIVNLAKQDWPIENQQVLRHCILRANESMFGFLEEYPAQERISTIRGILKWDLLDHHLAAAASKEIFDGIAAVWEPYMGAKILQLTGKNSCVDAKHVWEADDDPIDSDQSFRKANREKNQLLLSGFDENNSHDGKPRIVLVHGGFGKGAFAFLRIYFENAEPIQLTENIMLLPDLAGAIAEEFVADPMPALKPIVVEKESEVLPAEPLVKLKNVTSHS
jgi:hypothetical protein